MFLGDGPRRMRAKRLDGKMSSRTGEGPRFLRSRMRVDQVWKAECGP